MLKAEQGVGAQWLTWVVPMAYFTVRKRKPEHVLSEHDLVQEVRRLRAENDQLHRAVTSHAVVDQAIGAVVVMGRIRPEEGFDVLREVSQHTNIKLATIAEHVLKYAQGGALPDPVLTELRAAFARRG